MRNLLNPKWLLIINTLPILVLFYLFFSEFKIIKSLLDVTNVQLWKNFALSLSIISTLNLVYALYLILKKQKVSAIYGILALLVYISFIYLYGYKSNDIIPFSIPRWMISGDLILYVGTFLMPTLVYSLIVLVTHFTTNSQNPKAWISFTSAILVPIVWYLVSQIILPLWKPVEGNFRNHAIIILVIIGTLIFLFFLIKGIYIIASKKAEVWKNYELAWKIPISIFLPLLGLAINNGRISNFLGTGIFGDFNNNWFYILAILNGILICLPNFETKTYRLFLFIGRSICFSYTFYFFLVFLPFLPLSIIAIIAVGIGFLMLTPLVLFVIHINELSRDFSYLQSFLSKNKLRLISILAFLTIPVLITITYLNDKNTLEEALEYIYTPNYSKSYHINRSSLQNTINIVKQHKNRNEVPLIGSKLPYLSTYFNWLVLDNLTLSDKKINTIEKIFFNHTSFNLRKENIRNDQVEISNINTECSYDKNQKTWKSWVNLEITNHNNSNFSEYATTIHLPEGCWVSDYYLYVGNRKEMGILAEKKSAMWVFSQIRNENRDPGILYYLSGNKVAFRVFPFAKEETRRTGIEFIHKEPMNISIDGKTISLGNAIENQNYNFENKDLVYVSAQHKKTLEQIERNAYFHFLVDVSEGNKANLKSFASRIEQLIKKHKSLSYNAKISFVNSYTNTIDFNSNWKEHFNSQNFEGGYYLDRAIKKTLFQSYKSPTNNYPVMVAVTDSLDEAILDQDFSDFKLSYPDLDLFFCIDENNELQAHSLSSKPKKQVSKFGKNLFSNSVLKYSNTDNSISYLANNNEASIILKKTVFQNSNLEIQEKNWYSALNIQAKWISQVFHPEATNQEWISLVKSSFSAKIMTPVTSFLAVENESQKAILKKKQEQILSGNQSLDPGEDTQRMSEPKLLSLIIPIIAFMCIYIRKKIARLFRKNNALKC